MAIVKCANSHYFDNEKFSECPHCANLAGGGVQKEDFSESLEAQKVGSYAADYIRKNRMGAERDEEKTVGIYRKREYCGCTAGWLVCIEGEEYGRDFPLYAGFNRIGRSKENDVVLTDPQVSREEHCSVIYEEKKNVFYLFPKAGNLTYIGEVPVDEAKMIESGQVITVGQTRLEFVAFCVEEKRWNRPITSV